MQDRRERAADMQRTCPYPVLVDTWENTFDDMFRAWPDQYYLLDRQGHLIAKSSYSTHADNMAMLKVDCTDMLQTLLDVGIKEYMI
jgi:hypothetical protein